MAITESKIWQFINQYQKTKKDCHFIRVESSTINGIPDINGVMNGQEFWLELKVNQGNNLGLSKYQVLWHLKRLRANGNCYILHTTDTRPKVELLRIRESRSENLVPSFENLVSISRSNPRWSLMVREVLEWLQRSPGFYSADRKLDK